MKNFIQENAFENVVCQNGDPFVQGEMRYAFVPFYRCCKCKTIDQTKAGHLAFKGDFVTWNIYDKSICSAAHIQIFFGEL